MYGFDKCHIVTDVQNKNQDISNNTPRKFCRTSGNFKKDTLYLHKHK